MAKTPSLSGWRSKNNPWPNDHDFFSILVLLWHPASEVPSFVEFPPLPTALDWEPPTAPLPKTPDYADREDPFSLWIAEQEQPPAKKPVKGSLRGRVEEVRREERCLVFEIQVGYLYM